MSIDIAIVGVACCFPDAKTPPELWENVLAQRQAFRRLPSERLNLEDYWSRDRDAIDCIYSSEAAVIEGYEFDRVRFRIAGETFRSTDLAHWLALDVAAQALQDASLEDGEGLPREATGVFVGNTLTGEFSRASVLRLRWPFVRRVVEASLEDDLSPQQRQRFLEKLEAEFKKPFPPINEESLAGGLSNTIAGRICNYFNFKGGGYTVDGACASSLLALANGCRALVNGELDAALVGGVDLSLDPFELVGFAKAGALATGTMRVYDARSNGFWPGEGCGFVVLMRLEDALARRLRTYAVIKGWGISSDGNGGITRPETEGQLLALNRAYARAGFEIDTVGYVEGHGTGTGVGDAVELQALSRARREANSNGRPTVIGSIKANIGHTKAAAGIAGLLKATFALSTGTLPPTTGCVNPHPTLLGPSPALRIIRKGEAWPSHQPRRAGVSSMGFGGINVHVVLQAVDDEFHGAVHKSRRPIISSGQDAELFLFESNNKEQLLSQVNHLAKFADKLSRAELTDLAAHLKQNLSRGKFRAALVSSTPAELAEQLKKLATVAANERKTIDPENRVFFASGEMNARVGYLFPGQSSPPNVNGGALRGRFDFLEDVYQQSLVDEAADEKQTHIAQPAIAMNSIAAVRVLDRLNLTANIAVGHSLGELTALCWAGAFSVQTLLTLARTRGQAMSQLSGPNGVMASVRASERDVLSLINGGGVSIAAVNSILQTVVSGESQAVAAFLKLAKARRFSAIRLPVSHAFHSTLVADAAPLFARRLASEELKPLQRQVVSTVSGKPLDRDVDLVELLTQQITLPVRFLQAVKAASDVDLWIEVGPGGVLKGIMKDISDTPVLSIDAGGESLKGLLTAAGAAFVLGQPVDFEVLFSDRLTKPIDLNWRPKFFANPCEMSFDPKNGVELEGQCRDVMERTAQTASTQGTATTPKSALDVLTELVAKKLDLPVSSVLPENNFLRDLHWNSISVAEVVGEAAQLLKLPIPASATDSADATIEEVARAFQEQLVFPPEFHGVEFAAEPVGVDSWIRPFRVELVRKDLLTPVHETVGSWQVFGAPNDPMVELLRKRLTGCGKGILLCLPPKADEAMLPELLSVARRVLAEKDNPRFALLQRGWSAAAFARTLYLEMPGISTCVVHIPDSTPEAVDWVVGECMSAKGYVEAHYDINGQRYEPVVTPLPFVEGSGELPIGTDDVLLITGGARGITAECAFTLARESGARLVLIGRSKPDSDQEVSANLRRFKAAGIDYRYVSGDVTDMAQVRAMVKAVEGEIGAITGILHGAAVNVPQSISTLDQAELDRTIAVKVQGARNLLAAVNPKKLKLLVTFGSIISRTGLKGEAHYGLANEWLTQICEEWKVANPDCRCLALEWSIWSGKGMGERLGRADRLLRQGITPIPPDRGVKMLCDLLRQPTPVAMIVASRFASLDTFKLDRSGLSSHRFLNNVRVYYPKIELVADVELSTGSDPYLNDHVFQNQRLLPAVISLEAMAQVATTLLGFGPSFTFENVLFKRPLIVPESEVLKVRIAALKVSKDRVRVVVRSEATNFQLDHIEAEFHLCETDHSQAVSEKQIDHRGVDPMTIDPQSDLYGRVLFQGGRFKRIRNYRLLHSKECYAEIATEPAGQWFGDYFSQSLVLGDPGSRDAFVHAVQACLPHQTLLPIGVERVWIRSDRSTGPLFVHALERSHQDDLFIYDLFVSDGSGCSIEVWQGLQMRVLATKQISQWGDCLLAPYVERYIEELIPEARISIGLVRSASSDLAVRNALGEQAIVYKRPDGKPEIDSDKTVSIAHRANLTLAVVGFGSVACDIEEISDRPPRIWKTLIGDERIQLAQLIARHSGENPVISATRVWTAIECLKKVGAFANAPLVLHSAPGDGWILLNSGNFTVASFLAKFQDDDTKVVSVLVERSQCDTMNIDTSSVLRKRAS